VQKFVLPRQGGAILAIPVKAGFGAVVVVLTGKGLDTSAVVKHGFGIPTVAADMDRFVREGEREVDSNVWFCLVKGILDHFACYTHNRTFRWY
jgi:hypothetical protein